MVPASMVLAEVVGVSTGLRTMVEDNLLRIDTWSLDVWYLVNVGHVSRGDEDANSASAAFSSLAALSVDRWYEDHMGE